jgi:hypothetical protein
MMEVLYWHLHVPLRLFILQVSYLMFFCHGLAFCHILVVVRDHALPTPVTRNFKHCIHPPYLETTFSINSQNMWHVTITTNPLKWIEILYWTFTIFRPYKPSHHNWHWVCQPCFNLGLFNTPFTKSSTGTPPCLQIQLYIAFGIIQFHITAVGIGMYYPWIRGSAYN